MSLQRICDRCGAPAAPMPLSTQNTTQTFVVPQADPASVPVIADFAISIGLASTQDLCGPCLASALVEYALVKFGLSLLSETQAAALLIRLSSALQTKAVGAA